MIGKLVRRRREARGWTQTDLALESGLRQVYISQVESGDIKLPRDHNLEALGKALGISKREFYAEAGMLEGLPEEVMPPRPPVEEPTGDGPYDVRRIVAFVEDFPGEKFQRNLAEDAEYMSPEEYEEYCVNIWRMWAGNGDLAHGLARAMRPRPRRPTDEPATKG